MIIHGERCPTCGVWRPRQGPNLPLGACPWCPVMGPRRCCVKGCGVVLLYQWEKDAGKCGCCLQEAQNRPPPTDLPATWGAPVEDPPVFDGTQLGLLVVIVMCIVLVVVMSFCGV